MFLRCCFLAGPFMLYLGFQQFARLFVGCLSFLVDIWSPCSSYRESFCFWTFGQPGLFVVPFLRWFMNKYESFSQDNWMPGSLLVFPKMGECTSSNISPSLAILCKNLCDSICLLLVCDFTFLLHVVKRVVFTKYKGKTSSCHHKYYMSNNYRLQACFIQRVNSVFELLDRHVSLLFPFWNGSWINMNPFLRIIACWNCTSFPPNGWMY